MLTWAQRLHKPIASCKSTTSPWSAMSLVAMLLLRCIFALLLPMAAALREQPSASRTGEAGFQTASGLEPDSDEIVKKGAWKYEDAEANFAWLKPAIKECYTKHTWTGMDGGANANYQLMAMCIKEECNYIPLGNYFCLYKTQEGYEQYYCY